MHFKSILVGLVLVLGFISCGPETNDSTSKIHVSTTTNAPVVKADGMVEFNLLTNITEQSDIDYLYTWTFADGTTSTSSIALMSHQFTLNGEQNVKLVISDKNGKAQPVTVNIKVNVTTASDNTGAVKPYTSLLVQAMDAFISDKDGFKAPCSNCHYIGSANTNLNFKLSASAELTQASIESGLISWVEAGGNANYLNPIDPARTNHITKFSLVPETETANVELWTDLVAAMVQYVEDQADQSNLKPDAVIKSELVSDHTYLFDASDSSDPEGADLIYSWNFGDDSVISNLMKPSHTFAADKRYTVTLTVSDGKKDDVAVVIISTKQVLVGNPVTGEALYNEQCDSCHKEFGVGISGLYEPIAINRYIDGIDDLFYKIEATMPQNKSGECVEQCAADIQAYMLSWERHITNYSCPVEKIDATKYGPRQMRLLTIDEYANTVKDLFGYDVDKSKLSANAQIHEFDNQVKTAVDFNRFKSYEALATIIADNAALTNFVNVKGAGACVASGDCSNAFVTNVAKNAYRRPLDATEQAAYLGLFDSTDAGTSGDALESMRLAVRTMLMSPYFLYRSELGMTRAEFIDFNENAPPVYRPIGNPQDINLSIAGGELDVYGSTQFSYDFQGGEQIQITSVGSNSIGYNDTQESDAWPTLKVGIQNGATLFEQNIPPAATTVLIPVTVTGNQTISIQNSTSNHPQSNSRLLTIDSVQVAQFEQIQFEIPEMDDDAYALTPYEMATFIAYTYTGTTPDSTLMSAADEGLFTDAAVQAQIERLLATDKAKTHFGNFAAQWLTTDAVLVSEKDATKYPDYTDAVRESMAQEVREIFNDVLFNDTAPFSYLYDSTYTFVDSTLADFYGLGGVSGDGFVKTTAPGRGGLVTSGAFLSAWTSPTESKLILRGVRLRERFLCQHLPPFPSNIDLGEIRNEQAAEVDRVKAQNNGVIRQSHLDFINTDVAQCKTCHEYIINPLGVGLEDFDAVGLPRTNYINDDGSVGLSVNFTGFQPEKANHNSVFYGIDDMYDSTQFRVFQGAEGLGELLATEDVTKACMIEMSFRFMMGTGPDEFDHANTEAVVMTESEREDYVCTTDSMISKMNQNSDNPKAAIIEFGISDIVRFRKQRNR
ncbi:DUF1592 domain-containing protein [Marinicellulosiphila megalodicopiae]|uniref:DUF1592 domain-containing protein n=1 Tax=Marinicellulosiphila megalodicopiae TaxID=2724896 RepID=UPI003BAE5323